MKKQAKMMLLGKLPSVEEVAAASISKTSLTAKDHLNPQPIVTQTISNITPVINEGLLGPPLLPISKVGHLQSQEKEASDAVTELPPADELLHK